jgi:Zn-dependent M32 family carboxypeptidase
MDKLTATKFVERIEAHREKEASIWQEMRERDDYAMNEDKSIESIIDERQRARDLLESADASLDAFDWVDDGTGNFVPRDELESVNQ